MSFALYYVPIKCSMFFNLFILCLISCFVCLLSILHILCFVYFFSPVYPVVYFLFVYNFTDHCNRLETNLQLIIIIYGIIKGRDSAVGIATRYGLDGPGIESR